MLVSRPEILFQVWEAGEILDDVFRSNPSWHQLEIPQNEYRAKYFFFTRSKQFCTETDLNFLTCTKNINLIFVFINISFRWFARRRCAYDFKTGRLDFEDWTASEFENFPTFDIAIHAGMIEIDFSESLIRFLKFIYSGKAIKFWKIIKWPWA